MEKVGKKTLEGVDVLLYKYSLLWVKAALCSSVVLLPNEAEWTFPGVQCLRRRRSEFDPWLGI